MVIAPAPVVIDTLRRVAACGVGLWDAASGRVAAGGLVVRVVPVIGDRRLPPIDAAANRRGIFVVHRLPADGRGSPPASLLIDVHDLRGRFMSFVMHVDIADRPGLIVPPCLARLSADASPPPAPVFVPLFDTPARTPPAGAAVVRTSLRDGDTGQPAAFAVVEVSEAGRVIGRGVADARGEVAVLFPYPEPSPLPPWSPPARPAPPVPLAEQTWSLDLHVRYRRDLPRYRIDATRAPAPDLCELIAQPYAVLSTASPPTAATDITVRYGQELVLAGPNGDPLVVDPA